MISNDFMYTDEYAGNAMTVFPKIGDPNYNGALKKDIPYTDFRNLVITKYDINGKEVVSYKGKFKVTEYTDHTIRFETEGGKMYLIMISSGSITVEEKEN